jgi:hypothetical protein
MRSEHYFIIMAIINGAGQSINDREPGGVWLP